jgi:hypothetical protein
MRMRQRARRPRAGQDEMWLTLPPSLAEAQEEDAPAPKRSEEPTYEDHWYQVLRRRLGERSAAD